MSSPGSIRLQKSLKILAVLFLSICLLLPSVPVYAVESATPTGIPLAEIGPAVDEMVANYMSEFTPGFAIAVVKDGEIVFLRGYGYADIERQIMVDPSTTIFEYGSIGKLFVYVSVMQLVEQNLLDLDLDIDAYLPADLNRQFNFAHSFTMRDILNHSAGFAEFFFNAFVDAENVTTETTLREALLATQPRQIFTPGTASSYSNFAIGLAAYIVSQISGEDFSSFERANILNPLGMLNTRNQPDWFGDKEFMQLKARGYQPDGNGGFVRAPWWYIGQYPAGSLRGTVEDLAQLAIALMPPEGEAGPLFDSRATLDLMLSPSYHNSSIMRGTYHGFMSYDGIYATLGHSGGTQGFNTEFAIVPSERFGVIMLSNAAGGMEFNNQVLDLLIGNQMNSITPLADNLPDAASVAGNYVMLRRHQGNMLEPLNFLFGTNLRVDAVDQNTIAVNMMGMTLTYRQTEPYLFRLIASESALGRVAYELYFRMENGRPIGVSPSGPFDATSQTLAQSMPALLGQAIIAVISMIFFLLVAPIIILVKFLRKKAGKASAFNHLSNGLWLAGALLVLNSLVLIIRIGAVAPFISAQLVNMHIWLNYLLAALIGILLVASLVSWRKNLAKASHKVFYFLTIVMVMLFVIVLGVWNFFVLI